MANKEKEFKLGDKKVFPCGYCPRTILAAKNIFTHKGKAVCPACRAVKFSPFKKQILADKKKFIKDLKVVNKLFDKKENDRVAEIASEPIDKNGKRTRKFF